jgi:dipeptidyl aminopeptidase/acylaminoacyl peptidase
MVVKVIQAGNQGDDHRSGRTHLLHIAIAWACSLLEVSMAQGAQFSAAGGPFVHRDARGVTVADVVQMTQLADEEYLGGIRAKADPGLFSPDGRSFLIVTRRGNIADNTNVYSLLLFRTDQAHSKMAPEVLTSFASSSNNPGIRDVKWVTDQTVAFIGENAGELQQVYEVDCETKVLTKLTNHTTNVVAYAFAKSDADRFFLAERPVEPIFDNRAGKDGVIVSSEPLADLLAGQDRRYARQFAELFVIAKAAPGEILVKTRTDLLPGNLWLSPNGRFLVAIASVRTIPELWKSYKDQWLQSRVRAIPLHGDPQLVFQYWLVDIQADTAQALLNAPLSDERSEVLWAPDSKSVVVSGVYLPLNVADPAERELRQSTSVTAEIRVPNLEIEPISSKKWRLRSWDADTNALLVEAGDDTSTSRSHGDLTAFRKTPQGWKEVKLPGKVWERAPRTTVLLQEDMNTPPTLLIADRRTGGKLARWDFNPQFNTLSFGHVRNVTFKATDGHSVRGGVYLPPDYLQGQKYPLVIQTHAWNPRRFWIDGPWPSAFAAQPLASRHFIVLQMEEALPGASTAEEAPSEASAYEGAIDYLEGLGMIYRDRVGIIGFSRTGLGVEYALTHSKYHFSAATIADGSDGGYYFYLTVLPSFSWRWPDLEAINGGAPFGHEGLAAWIKNSPDFNLSRIDTPVREESYHPMSLFSAWEWYAGLSRLGKPVELLYLPDAEHVLVRPRDRMTSQQGNVDWFGFWLQGYEDPDPSKADQYQRWRELRKLQEAQDSERAKAGQDSTTAH